LDGLQLKTPDTDDVAQAFIGEIYTPGTYPPQRDYKAEEARKEAFTAWLNKHDDAIWTSAMERAARLVKAYGHQSLSYSVADLKEERTVGAW
jgi:hypothetical protein